MNLYPCTTVAPPAPKVLPEVGTFGHRVTLQADFSYLSPDEAEDLAEKLQAAAGEARSALLSKRWQP